MEAVATLLIGNVGLAIVLAALIVPLIALAYLHRAKARQGTALVSVVLVGGLAGAGLALLTRLYLEQLPVAQLLAMARGRPPLSLVLLLGVTLSLLGELAKLAGPLLLRSWPRFRDETMDGVILGVASGVGFAAVSTLVNYWPIIRDGYASTGAAGIAHWTATLAGLAIVRPLVHGATSGLIGAGIWASTLRRGSATLPVAVGLGGAVAYGLGEQLLIGWGAPAVLALHALVLAVLLAVLCRTIRQARRLDAEAAGRGRACGTLSA